MGEEQPPGEVVDGVVVATASNATVNSGGGGGAEADQKAGEVGRKKAERMSRVVRSLEFKAYDSWMIREMCRKV